MASDDFSETRTSFESVPVPGGIWGQIAGSFTSSRGFAFRTKRLESANPIRFAILTTQEPIVRIEAEMVDSAPGSGVVFGFIDDFNYWSLTAVPSFGTWNLTKVRNGIPNFVGNSGVGFTPKLTRIVIEINNTSIWVDLGNGIKASSDTNVENNRAGIISATENDPTRWNSFTVFAAAD